MYVLLFLDVDMEEKAFQMPFCEIKYMHFN